MLKMKQKSTNPNYIKHMDEIALSKVNFTTNMYLPDSRGKRSWCLVLQILAIHNKMLPIYII